MGRDDAGWAELARLQGRFLELLDRALGTGGSSLEGGGDAVWRPAADLVETNDGFVLLAELPGVDRSDVELRVEGSWLEMTGQRRPVDVEHTFSRLERRYGSFRRRVELPAAADAEAIEATLEAGVLEVRIPKRPTGSRVPIGDER